MKSVVWTYQNKKPVIYELDKYYLIKNEKQMDNLIDKLIEIDAVVTPSDLKFPVLLELESGFGPTLVKANVAKINKDLVKIAKLVSDV